MQTHGDGVYHSRQAAGISTAAENVAGRSVHKSCSTDRLPLVADLDKFI